MKRLKKKVLFLLGLCILALPAGCTSGEKTTEKDIKQKEELVLWSYYETDNQKAAMDDLVRGFNESQDSYHLTWEYHGPLTEFNKRLAIGITQDQLPDMVIMDNPDIPSYIKMDKFEDITEAVKGIEDLDQYFPNDQCMTKIMHREETQNARQTKRF